MKGQLRIAKTTEVENPLTLNEWTKKYKFGSRVQRKQLDIDMYKRGEYNFQKLVNVINDGANKPAWYYRIFKIITA